MIHNLSNDTTLNDLEWPLTLISRSQHFSTLIISTSIGNHMRSIAWWHFQWPWRTS